MTSPRVISLISALIFSGSLVLATTIGCSTWSSIIDKNNDAAYKRECLHQRGEIEYATIDTCIPDGAWGHPK